MDSRERNDERRNSGSAGRDENTSADDSLRDAPPGSSTLSSSPPTRGPSDNPVQRSQRDAGDALADQVRDGKWNSAAEERDEERDR